MNRDDLPPCNHCGSVNVLPFEDDTPDRGDTTLFIAILTAVILITGYLLIVVTSYLYYPIVVFGAIIVTTRLINKKQQERKTRVLRGPSDYICLDCGRSFLI